MSPRNPSPRAGDNGDDMRASWSPEDTETVLRGHRPQSADAAHLVPAIAALRSRAHGTANDSAVAAMASLLSEAALASTRASRLQALRLAPPRPSTPWRRRASIAGVVAILASAGLAGTAAAADGAAPGDALYGVDRALEVIGIDDGGSSERLVEAGKLANKGDVQGALHHAAEALQDAGDASSSEALLAAADQVAAGGGANSSEVRARVSEMLQWMSHADVKGRDFGQTVSSYARGVGGGNGADAGAAGGQGNSGNHANPGVPGNADPAGGSNPAGNTDSPGKAGEPGNSGKAGQDASAPSGGSGSSPGKSHGG
jgi:hypothetical protein